ncbi:hypothetical protein EV194_102304 [Natronoflexus pectinivorans]|uniref:Uncharacterized protein n=1 Tax=Natronoflexus pectinivorans TaxID=682526 RepID=A0A4R2GLK5_9BACT|nr:hypothetical protein EV194_102304 [Natronoflexus pectinivorans]
MTLFNFPKLLLPQKRLIISKLVSLIIDVCLKINKNYQIFEIIRREPF